MTPGTLVAIMPYAVPTVGVVVKLVTADVVSVMVWNAARGRWLKPADFELAKLGEAPAEWKSTQTATKNIKGHHGVVPYGGSFTRWIRVWADGKEPIAS